MTEKSELLVLMDLGPASRITHGDPYQWPWYEMSLPPYNHFCPIC